MLKCLGIVNYRKYKKVLFYSLNHYFVSKFEVKIICDADEEIF